MRFKLIVHSKRIVREVWYVEAENQDTAIEDYHDCCDNVSFEEEETIDTPESWIDEVYNLDDPTGDLDMDEGL